MFLPQSGTPISCVTSLMNWWVIWDSYFIMCSVNWNFFTSEWRFCEEFWFWGSICDLVQTGAACSELASMHQILMWSWSILHVRKSRNSFLERHFVNSTGQNVWCCINKRQSLWNSLSLSLINFCEVFVKEEMECSTTMQQCPGVILVKN